MENASLFLGNASNFQHLKRYTKDSTEKIEGKNEAASYHWQQNLDFNGFRLKRRLF